MEFSPPQVKILEHGKSPNTSHFAGGAIRSGKTWATARSFGLWMMRDEEPRDYAIVGQSIEAIMRNLGFDLINFLGDLNIGARLSKDIGTRIKVGNKSIWIFGANDARARTRIQGATLKGMVVDELPLVPEDFFMQAWGRLSVEGAKMWCTYNPEGPAHWAKRKVIDRADKFRGEVNQFLMRDNPSLSEDTIGRYEESFTGHWKQRYIDGIWAGASGLVFPEFYKPSAPLVNPQHTLALDWAVSSVLHCLLIAHRGKNAQVIAEYRHDARETFVKTEAQQHESLMAWLDALGLKTFGLVCYLDPFTPASFKGLLRESGLTVKHADNTVLPGLITTAQRLQSKEITVSTECRYLREEMLGYLWDERKSELGTDAPVKYNDHGCDALRYFAYTTGKAWRAGSLKNTLVKDAL